MTQAQAELQARLCLRRPGSHVLVLFQLWRRTCEPPYTKEDILYWISMLAGIS